MMKRTEKAGLLRSVMPYAREYKEIFTQVLRNKNTTL